MNQYEAMFLFDPTFGTTWDNCEGEIRRLMERAQAEIIVCRQWDERRLAYKIRGRKRGVYALVYFKAPPDKIGPLERDAELSENILRVLVLRADDLTPEAMERGFQQSVAEPARDEGRPDWNDNRGRRDSGRSDRHRGRESAPAAEPVLE